jgi:hypothetical protein
MPWSYLSIAPYLKKWKRRKDGRGDEKMDKEKGWMNIYMNKLRITDGGMILPSVPSSV